jgi:alanyl-tRNA synthetase
VRRIEAATGLNALAYTRSVESALRRAARSLKVSPADVNDKLERLVEHEKQLEREITELRRQVALGAMDRGSGAGGIDEIVKEARNVPGGKALAVKVSASDAATLREMAERLRDKLGEAVVLVGAVGSDKAMLVLTVSKGLTGRYHAGDLVKAIAQLLGGSGGGRPDLGQAGGAQMDRLDEALDSLYARLT